jgi:hypothetical protein
MCENILREVFQNHVLDREFKAGHAREITPFFNVQQCEYRHDGVKISYSALVLPYREYTIKSSLVTVRVDGELVAHKRQRDYL